MTNTYVDATTYSKAATGLVLSSLYGNLAHMSSCLAGATSITVPATTVALNQYDALYITDGANSETLQVGSGGALAGATSIPLQSPTTYAHAGGTAYCTDGASGSIGQAIFEASRWLEDICYQSLYTTAYTGEILTMPTMRAAIDNQWNLHFRPRHFPVTALTSIVIQVNNLSTWTFDATQAIIDADQQTVDLPVINLLNSTNSQAQQSNPWFWPALTRQTNAWITLAYTAGYASIPWAVRRACILLTSATFAQLENPVGADQITQGKRTVIFTLRGDQSGRSLLVKEAMGLLGPYIAQSF